MDSSKNSLPACLPLDKLLKFTRFIQLARPTLEHEADDPLKHPPLHLPFSIAQALARAVSIDVVAARQCWDYLRESVWSMGNSMANSASAADISEFNEYVLPFGTSYRHLYPPVRHCESCCAPLKEPSKHKASLFTLREGALPVYTTSMYCRACKLVYYHNYIVHAASGLRTYYGGVPDVIEVAKHFFMDAALLEFISSAMVFAWVSSSNAARIYSAALARADSHILNNLLAYHGYHAQVRSPTSSWAVSLNLQGEHVLNGFFLYSLLLDKSERQERLILSNTSNQRDRIHEALVERNKRMEGVGQEAYTHACDLCFATFKNEKGEQVKMQAAVCDGNTIGCPTCNVHNCTNPLENQRARFCREHGYLQSVCAVTSCGLPVAPGRRSCVMSEHQALEDAYFEKGRAIFQLKDRLKKARAANGLADSIPSVADCNFPDLLFDEDIEELTTETEAQTCDSKHAEGNRKLKAYFGRRRTHNEQLIMRPCGVILSRATFYGAEAISSVHEFMKATFPTPESTPEVYWFDNNCSLHAHQRRVGDTHFLQTAMPVDVFHFKAKHKVTDTYCQMHCNPAAFPELFEGNKWRFNSSICEQTNVWVGGYQPILRDMEITRYTFFLDEMIKRHNRFVIAKLDKDGHCPWTIPIDFLFPKNNST